MSDQMKRWKAETVKVKAALEEQARTGQRGSVSAQSRGEQSAPPQLTGAGNRRPPAALAAAAESSAPQPTSEAGLMNSWQEYDPSTSEPAKIVPIPLIDPDAFTDPFAHLLQTKHEKVAWLKRTVLSLCEILGMGFHPYDNEWDKSTAPRYLTGVAPPFALNFTIAKVFKSFLAEEVQLGRSEAVKAVKNSLATQGAAKTKNGKLSNSEKDLYGKMDKQMKQAQSDSRKKNVTFGFAYESAKRFVSVPAEFGHRKTLSFAHPIKKMADLLTHAYVYEYLVLNLFGLLQRVTLVWDTACKKCTILWTEGIREGDTIALQAPLRVIAATRVSAADRLVQAHAEGPRFQQTAAAGPAGGPSSQEVAFVFNSTGVSQELGQFENLRGRFSVSTVFDQYKESERQFAFVILPSGQEAVAYKDAGEVDGMHRIDLVLRPRCYEADGLPPEMQAVKKRLWDQANDERTGVAGLAKRTRSFKDLRQLESPLLGSGDADAQPPRYQAILPTAQAGFDLRANRRPKYAWVTTNGDLVLKYYDLPKEQSSDDPASSAARPPTQGPPSNLVQSAEDVVMVDVTNA